MFRRFFVLSLITEDIKQKKNNFIHHNIAPMSIVGWPPTKGRLMRI